MVVYIILSLSKLRNYDYNVTQANNSYYDLEQQDDLRFEETRITIFHVIKRLQFTNNESSNNLPYKPELQIN